jgi:TetR/AcrR family transcriptional regulator of autoinduction and epiphytic fitness
VQGTVTQTRSGSPIRSQKVARRRHRMRDELVAAGEKLFVANGFAAVSVEDLIAAAGVSRATFYDIFANKQELAAAILEPVLTAGVEALDALAPAPPADILPGLIHVYEELWANRRNALCLIAGIDESVFPLVRDGHERFTTRLRRLLETAEGAGMLRNASAQLSFRVLARTAVPLLRVYADEPNWRALFRDAMAGLLVK